MQRKILRPDANGVLQVVEVPADYVLQAGEQDVTPDATQPQDTLKPSVEGPVGSPAALPIPEDLLNKIRQEERAKLNSSISRSKTEAEKLRKQVEEAQARAAELEKQKKEAELAALQPSERVQAELAEANRRIAEMEAQTRAEREAAEAQMRAYQLTSYRERAIRHYGEQIFPQTVVGSTEEEIDQAAQASHEAWVREFNAMKAKIEAEVTAKYRSAPAATPPAVYTPPPNAAYVPPPASAAPPSFPTAPNPEPVTPASVAPGMAIPALTGEDAVRSGRWSGEVRAAALAQLRHQQAHNLGSAPRHLVAPPPPHHVPMPNGVVQPVGLPTPPAATAATMALQAMPGTPQAAPQAPQQYAAPTDPASAAAAAVARTHAGANPMIAQNPGAAEALQKAQAAAGGLTPQQLYAQRFANTPPVTE